MTLTRELQQKLTNNTPKLLLKCTAEIIARGATLRHCQVEANKITQQKPLHPKGSQ